MSLSDDARRFAEIPFLANLDPAALEAIAFVSETRIIRRGETLFHRGEPADSAFLLISGRLRLTAEDAEQGMDIEPGSLISEMALLVESTRRNTATAVEPSAVLLIPRTAFVRVLRDNPASAVRLRDFCAQRLAEFTTQLDAATSALAPPGATGEGEPEA